MKGRRPSTSKDDEASNTAIVRKDLEHSASNSTREKWNERTKNKKSREHFEVVKISGRRRMEYISKKNTVKEDSAQKNGGAKPGEDEKTNEKLHGHVALQRTRTTIC